MAALTSQALHSQLTVIMAALTEAAVAEICGLVEQGYAALHQENQDLRKKLHLIQSIVVRGGGGGGGGGGGQREEEEVKEELKEVKEEQQEEVLKEVKEERDGEGAESTAAAPGAGGGAAGSARGEVNTGNTQLPDVVLIKDEDSDSDDAVQEGNRADGDGGPPAAREPTPLGRSLRRKWAETEDGDRKLSGEQLPVAAVKVRSGGRRRSVSIYSVDSPHSEPGCSAQLGEQLEARELSYQSSPLDPDLQLVLQDCSLVPLAANRQSYLGSGALMESKSPGNRAELDHMAFPQFQQSENIDSDAFGLKLVSVSGATSTDCQLSESSSSTFEYEDADMMTYTIYREQPGRPQASGAARGKRFVCSVCSRTYATSQNLEVHMRIHTGERPFSCSQCGKKFTQSAHLKSHLSVHSGERPYACTLCSRSFVIKYSLKLHMRKCHLSV